MPAQPARVPESPAPEVEALALEVASLKDSVSEILGGLVALQAGVEEDRDFVRDLVNQLAERA